MTSPQQTIQNLLDSLVRDGAELGVQVVAYHRGKCVIDAWAGLADRATQRKVDGDTLFPVYSTTKGPVATLLHRLVARGLVQYDAPVAAYWPEFAQHGKAGITLRQVLNHTAGMAYMPADLSVATLNDWRQICAVLAAQTPATPPGAKQEYHAVNYGWLVGEVIARVLGRPLPECLAAEITRPLGIEHSMYIGIPAAEEPRVANLEEPVPPPRPDFTQPQTVAPAMFPLVPWMQTSLARRACLPGSNGIMTARAVARHYAALLPGGVDGVELLPPALVRQTSVLQIPPGMKEAELPFRSGLGYRVGGGGSQFGPRITAFGHPGYGGSTGFADPERQFAMALTKNRFSARGAQDQIVNAVRTALGIQD